MPITHNKRFIPWHLLLLAIFIAIPSTAHAAPTMPASTILNSLKPTHPRLIASAATWDTLKTRRRQDPVLDAFLKRDELEARALLDVPPVPYKLDESGRRLLHISRTVLRRVMLLSLQYHLTGDVALARRAQAEMLNVAAFKDWNPSHFLDVAEMTMALAFGYDWLYDELDASARQTIKAAIVEKGLQPGLTPNGWMTTTNNWNQVCFAGLSVGALAIAEDEPALAAQTLEKARQDNPHGMKPYAPAGVYPEGASYWGYGTTFQVVLLAALQSALGTDWGLSQSPGFMQSADALLQQRGPTGSYFNFFDGSERPGLEGGEFWFAHQLQRPELVTPALPELAHYSDLSRPAQPTSEGERLLPLISLWWPTATPNTVSLPLDWYGPGPNPLATFRSAWNDPNAMYLALKGGSASQSHGHMDAGSFIFESDGIRWARDLGMQAYAPLEAKKINLWNSEQNGGRWSIFRLNNFSHNTLTINNQLHRVDGRAAITHFSAAGKEAGAIVDLSPVFAGQASRVRRGFAFRSGSHALVRDEAEGLKAGDTVRFALLTQADIEISQDGAAATLSQAGKHLTVSLNGPAETKFEVISAQPPQNEYDEPNPGSHFLIANFVAPATGKLSWSVVLQPGSRTEKLEEDPLAATELKNWPFAVTNPQ